MFRFTLKFSSIIAQVHPNRTLFTPTLSVTFSKQYSTICAFFNNTSRLDTNLKTDLQVLTVQPVRHYRHRGLHPNRRYNRKNRAKLPPSLPFAFSNTGDVVKDFAVPNKLEPKVEYRDYFSTKSHPETLKKVLSVEFGDAQDYKRLLLTNVLEKVRLHELDTDSLEVRIALLTVKIRLMLKHCDTDRKEKRGKLILGGRIRKRLELLTQLRNLDIERFKWLLGELQLEYRPPGPYDKFKLSKRASRRDSVIKQALRMKHDKMQAFRDKLAEEKIAFEEFKEKELAGIKKELLELGASDGASLEQACEQVGIQVPHNKPLKRIRRRRRRLEHKFATYPEIYKAKAKPPILPEVY